GILPTKPGVVVLERHWKHLTSFVSTRTTGDNAGCRGDGRASKSRSKKMDPPQCREEIYLTSIAFLIDARVLGDVHRPKQ
ncbi:unnamed protein product, partial [Musa textilis]